ncbi:ATP-binding protein [Methylobacterium symbioticum]|uniref:histidine kinase n=1 Tax=Methylobacterium symbioticum TaxID=2584084 RepID=A0A509E8M3_9HYPH|nr:ATP-binding protein [Methylobacterium symbioticum]VUD70547.1 Autoinducer 2 sensor kinase/phosphatase LuxQ [Methylobacterium symbioticum]
MLPSAMTGAPESDDLAAVLDAVAGLVLRIDRAGLTTFASAGAHDLLGRAPADLVGRPFLSLLRPGDGEAIAQSLARGAAGPLPLNLLDARGALVTAEASFRPLPEGGRVATIRPVPEGDATLAGLRRGAEPGAGLVGAGDRTLADTLPQLVWMEGAETGETLYANRAFEAYCGPIGATRAARTGRFHPEDGPRIAAACLAAREQARPCEVQARIRGQACGYRWHQLVFRPLRRDGRWLGWLGSALDIDEIVTARKALEQTGDLLRLAQEAAAAGLFDVTLGTRHIILSPESARRHGLPGDRPAVIGLADWMRRILPADRAPVLRAVREAVSARRTFDVAFRVPTGAGPPRWIQAIGRPTRDADDAVARVTGLTFDITARKDTEQALVEAKAAAEAAKAAAEAARAQAEQANAAKTDFLSAMSHEIRTPLNAVIGFASLLAGSGRLDPDLRRYADLAQVAGESLRTVVDDILDFAAVEAGTVNLCPEPVAVRDLAATCLGIVGAAAAEKGLETVLEVDPAIPEILVADPGRLRQVLLNLLNNAVKFTPRGTVRLHLGHAGRSPQGERIRIAVSDTGIGIAPAQQARLFERFAQADSSIRRDFGGTGLGLAISRRLVERMGGTIDLVSEAGRGATFTVSLTLPAPPGGQGARPRPVPRSSVPAPEPASSGRILVVEDAAINRELAATVLRAAGHAVEVAEDGFGAVRAAETLDLDLVLMDIQMPGLDGMMATRLIRSLPGRAATVPVIAMTANVLPDQIGAFAAAGMDDHFAKPFRPTELRARVDRWLALPRREPAAVPASTLDRRRYAESAARLPPDTLRRLLRHFQAEAEAAFAEGEAAPVLRAQAHMLATAAGQIGFTALGKACLALEASGETVFVDALGAVRRLARAAAAETGGLIRETDAASDPGRLS